MVVAQEKIAAQIGADVLTARRQRGRCGGGHRFCDGGDLSARRQYRRRRLHGDPLGGAPRGRRDRLSRDRAGRDHARHFSWAPTASPTTRSRAIPRSASACPARSPGLALALEKYGSGKFTLAELAASRRSIWRATASSLADDSADTLPDGIGGWRAGRHRRRSFPAPTARRCARATGWSRAIWRPRFRRSPSRVRADFTRGRSPKSWSRRSATPAAS